MMTTKPLSTDCREIPFVFNEAYVELLCLRQAVLRTPLALTYNLPTLKGEVGQAHIGLYHAETGQLLGCCLIKQTADDWFQMRQVAVSPDYQGCGLGHQLIDYFEAYVLKHNGKRCFIEARTTVADFYLKKGYHIVNTAYLHPDSHLEHFRLEKHWA